MKLHPFVRLTAPPLAGFAAGFLVCLAFNSKPEPVISSAPKPALPRPSAQGRQGVSGIQAETPLPVRQANLTTAGYAAAGEDLASALARARTIADFAERSALLQGIFAWVARNRPPTEAIQLAKEQEGYYRNVALGVMVRQWSGKAEAPPVDSDGFSQRAAEILFYSQTTPRAAADAWLAAFSNDPGREAIATAYASVYYPGAPDKLLPMAESFTPWEREQFLGNSIAGWGARGEKEAGEAMVWLKKNWDQLPAAARSKALSGWAAGSPEKAMEEISATTDASLRKELIPAAAAALGQADTEKAVAWADSLSNPEEREAAHAAIHDAVPRGIGVVFTMPSGMPQLQEVMPGGAAETAGLLPGDRLVSVTGADERTIPLYGGSMTEVAQNLRGNSGESVRLRLLRTDPSGTTTELVLPVTRRQLVMK